MHLSIVYSSASQRSLKIVVGCRIIQPVLLYCSPSFFTMLTASNRNKLTRITNSAPKMTGLPTPNLCDLNCEAVIRRARTVTLNPRLATPPRSSHCFHLVADTDPWPGNKCVPSDIALLNRTPMLAVAWMCCIQYVGLCGICG